MLSLEIQKFAQRQDETVASLRKHMEATIDTNHQASSLVLGQLDELSNRVEKESLHTGLLEEKMTLDINRIAKMHQELGTAMTKELKHFEDSNQQAANSIQMFGKRTHEGLTEANMRFTVLETRCATIDERLLKQHDDLLDNIEKVALAVDTMASSG